MASQDLIIDDIVPAPNQRATQALAHAGTKYYSAYGDSPEEAVNKVIHTWLADQQNLPQNS